ncbi:unnamed protein product [Prunus armeniaca]
MQPTLKTVDVPWGVASLVRGGPLGATFGMNLLGLPAVCFSLTFCSSSRFLLPDTGVALFPKPPGLCTPGFGFVLGNSPTMSPLLEMKGKLRFWLRGMAFSSDTKPARRAVVGGNLSPGRDWNSRKEARQRF